MLRDAVGVIGRRVMIDAKGLDTVEEIGPRVVDGHARVVRILSPTLGGSAAHVMPHLLSFVQQVDVDWWALVVHHRKLGPLIRRCTIPKWTSCHRDCRLQFFPLIGLTSQVCGKWLCSWN